MQTLNILKNTAAVLFLTGSALIANAQKMVTVQEAGIAPPANVKADGKLTEWNDTFQAYNKSTLVYYTLANDANNLYLAIKCSSQLASAKIIAGGITLLVNPAGKKSEKDAASITFPTANVSNAYNLLSTIKPVGASGGMTADDSLEIKGLQKKAIAAAKEIKVSGVKDISQPTVSIYNDHGIKAGLNYDAKGNLTYELAVPLKYLNLTDGTPFAYSIKVNGIQTNNQPTAPSLGGVGGGGISALNPDNTKIQTVVFAPTSAVNSSSGGARQQSSLADDMQSMSFPTDFWGKYTLAK